jgi:diadenosine tetraphosphatase ApaH/serine/threonine PP2A family protein phosphatase
VSYPLTAILSDLHANVPALEVAVADARARGAERWVCLGDVVGYGAEPRACLEEVMRLCPTRALADGGVRGEDEPLCLLGNHEQALLEHAEDFNPRARAAIDWTREELSRGEDRERSYAFWEFLDTIRPAERDPLVLLVHGSPRDPVREYLLPRDSRNQAKMAACFGRMAELERAVCFVGHSHVPAVYYEDGRLFRPRGTEGPYDLAASPEGRRAIVNVGSIGQPRDGDPRLSYALFDGARLTFVRLEYDHRAAAERIRAVPELPDFLADRLAFGR